MTCANKKDSDGIYSKQERYKLRAEELRGQLHYVITIKQYCLEVYEMFDDLDPKDMIILDYIESIENYYTKKQTQPKFTYNHLLKSLPILKKEKSYSKASVSRVIEKLERLDLITVKRRHGKSNIVYLTEFAKEMLNFKQENSIQKPKVTVSPKEKHCVPTKKEHPVPNIVKRNSIKDRNNNNLYIEPNTSLDNNTDLKIKKYANEALNYFQSLEPNDRRLFDSRAFNLLDHSCPKPKPNSEEIIRLRIENYIYENEL